MESTQTQRRLIGFVLGLLASAGIQAETVTPRSDASVTDTTMINLLAGPGLSVSAPTFTGTDAQAGQFSGFAFLLGSDFDEGVILSSGNVVSVIGPNTADNTSNRINASSVNDPDLGNGVYDRSKLSFTAVPTFDVLLLDFVFGSDEYTEYVGDSFNDVARIRVNGTNCALTPAGDEVRINNINPGSVNNAGLYLNNDPNDGGVVFDTAMDGFTRRLSCRVPVIPGLPATVTVGTADVFDNQLNSWILFRAESMRSEPANDFGDAPDTYATLAASGGARHTIVEGVRLGAGAVNGDTDGFGDGIDDAPGLASDDQDNALASAPTISSSSATFSVNTTATSINALSSTVYGWVDFDRDGQFQADEASAPVNVPAGSYEMPITLSWSNIGGSGPDIASSGVSYMRLRIANSGLGASVFAGPVASGEVEDYRVIISDGQSPSAVSILRHTPATEVTAADSVTFRVAFSEPVFNVDASDFVATGGGASVQALSVVSETTFDVTVNGISSHDGVVSLALTGSADILDAEGNTLASPVAGTNQTYTLDNSSPTVALQGVPANINGSFTATVQFSEPVTGFVIGDITSSNATLSAFSAVDGDTYTVLVTPSAEGSFSLDVNAGAALDAAGNANTAATQVVGSLDATAPLVVIQNVPASTNTSFVATLQFSEPVSGFVVGDVIAGNATLSGFTSVDADTYTVLVTPTADGAITLDVGAAVATDAAGNGNAAAVQAAGTYDATAPTVLIQNIPATTNAALTATIQFSEAVSGFTLGDLSASNATLSAFSAVDGDTYTVLVTPTADGSFTLDVAAAVATDAAGNGNLAATQASGSFDSTAPTVAIQNVPANANAAFTATLQFSEAVSGFTIGDITAGNATLSAFSAVDGDTYTVLVTPGVDGSFTLDVAAAVATDVAGNGNLVATQASGSYDGTAPTVVIQNVPSDSNAVFTATIQFSEAVSGFVVGDIAVSNASLSAFTAIDGDTYTVQVTPTAEGSFTLDVGSSVATDGAGNGNTAAAQAVGNYDVSAPTVVIQGVPSDTNVPFTATIQFSEAVTGFVAGDITAGNASLSAFTAVDGDTYTVLVTPTAEGAFTLDVVAAVAQDVAGNPSAAASQATGNYDASAPTVTILNVPADTNTAFTATIQFSESVTGFAVGDIAVGNASLSGFAAIDGDTYTVLVTPSADGAYTLDVGAAVATDVAGNGNQASAQASGTYDVTAPTVAILNVPAETNAAFTATIQFSEAVSGFVIGDISAGNATLSTFTAVDGDTYTVLVTPTADGPYTLDVGAAVAIDDVGNGNVGATQAAGSYDSTPPATPGLDAVSADTGTDGADGITRDNTLLISGTGEPGSTVEVFSNGATIGSVAVSPLGLWMLDYSATALPDGSYALTASATDSAGNTSPLSPAFSLRVDTLAPAEPSVSAISDDTGASALDGITADNTLVVTGSAEAGASVEVFLDAVSVGVVTADGSGDWTLDLTGTSLSEGSYALTAVATDAAGNTGVSSAALAVVIDLSAPVAPQVATITDDTGASATDGVTRDNTLVIGGVAEAGTAVEVLLGGASLGSTTADAGGNWVFDYSATALADGDYTLTARATDTAGNDSPLSAQFALTIDTAAPVAPTLDQNGQTLEDNTPTLTGTAEANSSVTVTLGSGEVLQTVADGSGVWSVTATQPVGEGVLSVALVSEDSAGNSSAAAQGVTIDIQISEPNSAVTVLPGSLAADGMATATVSVSVRDTLNQPQAGLVLVVSPTLGTVSAVTDNGDGTYTATLTAPLVSGAGLVVVTTGGEAVGQQAVTFTPADADNDGLSNDDEDLDGDGDPTNDDLDGDGIPNYLDDDDDGDGKTTDEEDINNDGNPFNDDSDGDGIPDFLDGDDDSSDGTNDSDGDGIPDTVECSTGLPCQDTDNDGVPDYMDDDDDNDGIPSDVEGETRDSDGDGVPDYRDPDDDNDGLLTRDEDADVDGDGNPSTSPGPDLDGDGIPAYLDPNDALPGVGDTDGDGIGDDRECLAGGRCEDSDGDGLPDFNDPDDDNDNIPTRDEDVDNDGDPANDDTDGDGIPNYLDRDDDGDGIDSDLEGTGDSDGDGIPDYLDRDNSGAIDGSGDSDGDGLSDTFECPAGIPCRDSDGDGIPDYMDDDDDNDGVLTADEDINEDGDAANDDVDGDGTPNYLDRDDDGDGVDTVLEGTGDSDGDGIPDYLDPSAGDSDGDGLGDGIECPTGVPCPDLDGNGVPDFMDPDDDGDGVLTVDEDLDGNGDPRNEDSDGDGIPNYRDTDDDGDGVDSLIEGAGDSDGDGIPDYLDRDSSGAPGGGDSDGDGIVDSVECPTGIPCRDSDGDGLPDYLDEDDDNDGINTRDEDPDGNGDPLTDDTDQDGTLNYLDGDDDGDGVDTSVEGTGDSDGDGIPDHLDPSAGDSDGDGIGDGLECPTGIPCRDSDGDGIADYLDDDDDNDGVPTISEDSNGDGNPRNDDTDGDGTPNYLDTDDDGDGLPTLTEGVGDLDGDGIPDYLDADSNNLAGTDDGSGDSDGDGLSDAQECPTQPCADGNVDGIPDYMQRPQVGKVRTAISGVGAFGSWLFALIALLLPLRRRLGVMVVVLMPWVAQASQEPVRFYAGAGLVRSWLEPDTSDTSWSVGDENSHGWEVLGGYRLLDQVSLEGFYSDLGAATLRDRVTAAEEDVVYRVFGVAANWYPFQESWAGQDSLRWYVKAGLSSIDNSTGANATKDYDAVLAIGGGVEYEFSNRWQLRLSAQSHTRDAHVIGLSVLKAWGKSSSPVVQEQLAEPVVLEEEPEPVVLPVIADEDGDGVADERDACPGTPVGMAVNANGCSALDITLDGVYFSSGSAELEGASLPVLQKVVKSLNAFPSARVEIGAHTDAQGSDVLNQKLSEKRAASVKSYLVGQGVAAERLEVRGYGEAQPIADNGTAEGRAKNRRVEMKLLP